MLSVIFFGLLGYYYGTIDATPNTPIDQEYLIELVDQETVQVYSIDRDTVYECTMDDLEEVIARDNM